jgi:phosphomannomutase/phosphoglucomutase
VSPLFRQYPVNTIDGGAHDLSQGLGLIRSSNTQPVLVLRFEATDPKSLEDLPAGGDGWLVEQGVKTETA